jgi:hypothetical protein
MVRSASSRVSNHEAPLKAAMIRATRKMLEKAVSDTIVLHPSWNDEQSYTLLATATASSDSMITVASSCDDAFGCVRHCAIFSENDRLAS